MSYMFMKSTCFGIFRCVSQGNVEANHMREVCPTSGEFAGAVPAKETLQQADVRLMFLLSCIRVVAFHMNRRFLGCQRGLILAQKHRC